MSSTHTVASEKKPYIVSRSFAQRRFRQNTNHGSTQVARFSVETQQKVCATIIYFSWDFNEMSHSSQIRRTTNLNQNFWHSWGRHFLRTKCPYVESCKLQVGWFRLHTSQRFLKTRHDSTYIASFHITKRKGCLTVAFIRWVCVCEHHGTQRRKVYQENKNHLLHSNSSPRQSCPTVYNTLNLLRVPCRLFWLAVN